MSPEFSITNRILSLTAEIAELAGSIKETYVFDKNPVLRRKNRIETIHGSLSLEQNSLTLDQVTAVLNGKRVLAPPKDIEEVKNAFEIYELLDTLNPYSAKDMLKAHGVMMRGLVKDAGAFRDKPIGVVDSASGKIIHFGTLPAYVPDAVFSLIDWCKNSTLHPLIISCVFHYEFELIHPFSDGNGRLGRLWHTLILSKWNSFFAWLPVESIVFRHQEEYYSVINSCNEVCDCTAFIEFMLNLIKSVLTEAKDTTCLPQEQVEEQDDFVRLLDFCREPRTRAEMQAFLGVGGRKAFVSNYLSPLLQSGKLKMTVPDKPTSKNQKYITV